MFDKYILCEGSLANVSEDGHVSGFRVDVRIAYYRGLNLSMVEGFDLTVDGEFFPRESNRFFLRGKTYTLDEMETEYKERWEMIEGATLLVSKPGGLTPGQHRTAVVEYLRVSYVPDVVTGKDEKVLTLNA